MWFEDPHPLKQANCLAVPCLNRQWEMAFVMQYSILKSAS